MNPRDHFFPFPWRICRLWLPALILALLVCACQSAPGEDPTATAPVNSPALTASPAPDDTLPPGDVTPASGSPALAVTQLAAQQALSHYRIIANYDDASRRVNVQMAVGFTNTTGTALAALAMIVPPNRAAVDFNLQSLALDGKDILPTARLDGLRLDIPLDTALQSGSSASLNLSFNMQLPARASPFGYTQRQVNFGDWLPFIPVFREPDGWVINQPASVGEYLLYPLADYDLTFSVSHPRGEMLLAASALSEREGDAYRIIAPATRSLAFSISDEYVVLKAQSGEVAVTAYVFPEHEKAGQVSLDATAAAMRLYARLFASYPHQSLAVVEADFEDGMEYDGLFFLGSEFFTYYEGTPKGYLTALSVHETAHQWWSALIGNDPALHPYLDESLATYSELLFYEATYPELTDWWWEYRVNRYDPYGYVDSSIYDLNTFRGYVNAVYLRGARWLQFIRDAAGDTQFFAFLADYANNFSHSIATPDDFFTTLARYLPGSTADAKGGFFTP